MTPTPSIRRRVDGAIDFDFYRTRSIARRRQAMRDSAALKSACIGLSVIVVAFPLILAFVGASIRAPHNHFAVATPTAITEQVQ